MGNKNNGRYEVLGALVSNLNNPDLVGYSVYDLEEDVNILIEKEEALDLVSTYGSVNAKIVSRRQLNRLTGETYLVDTLRSTVEGVYFTDEDRIVSVFDIISDPVEITIEESMCSEKLWDRVLDIYYKLK